MAATDDVRLTGAMTIKVFDDHCHRRLNFSTGIDVDVDGMMGGQ
jgi:hypothetical protein